MKIGLNPFNLGKAASSSSAPKHATPPAPTTSPKSTQHLVLAARQQDGAQLSEKPEEAGKQASGSREMQGTYWLQAAVRQAQLYLESTWKDKSLDICHRLSLYLKQLSLAS